MSRVKHNITLDEYSLNCIRGTIYSEIGNQDINMKLLIEQSIDRYLQGNLMKVFEDDYVFQDFGISVSKNLILVRQIIDNYQNEDKIIEKLELEKFNKLSKYLIEFGNKWFGVKKDKQGNDKTVSKFSKLVKQVMKENNFDERVDEIVKSWDLEEQAS